MQTENTQTIRLPEIKTSFSEKASRPGSAASAASTNDSTERLTSLTDAPAEHIYKLQGKIWSTPYKMAQKEKHRIYLAELLEENMRAMRAVNITTMSDTVNRKARASSMRAAREIVRTGEVIKESWDVINKYKKAVQNIDDACEEKLRELEAELQEESSVDETIIEDVPSITIEECEVAKPKLHSRDLILGRLASDPETGYRMHPQSERHSRARVSQKTFTQSKAWAM